MPLKIFEHENVKYAVLDAEGRPVYVGADGKETGHDGEALATRLTEVNGESATRRRELKDANEKLKAFDGIDPAAATKALETVKNLEDKTLIDADEVGKVKQQAVAANEKKWQDTIDKEYKPVVAENEKLKAQLWDEKIGGRFARSKFIAEKMAVPVAMVDKTFREHFRVDEGGKVIALRDATLTGDDAVMPSNLIDGDFEDQIKELVEASPFKDQILKGANKSGGGAPGSGGGAGDGKTMTVEQFEAMPLGERNKFLTDGGKLQDAA